MQRFLVIAAIALLGWSLVVLVFAIWQLSHY
jgi:hypothetical protein